MGSAFGLKSDSQQATRRDRRVPSTGLIGQGGPSEEGDTSSCRLVSRPAGCCLARDSCVCTNHHGRCTRDRHAAGLGRGEVTRLPPTDVDPTNSGSTPTPAATDEPPINSQNSLLRQPIFVAQAQGDRAAADQGVEQRISALESAAAAEKKAFPLVRLSGFMQLDDGLFSQNSNSRATLGDIQNGAGFRRARLQALGSATETTRFSVEMDFASAGRPSFLDVWGEQMEIPFFGTVRVGQFRQPGTMDSWTSVRHMEFVERSAPFQALDPFRKIGMMAFRVADDQLSMIAYSVYATGSTRFSGAGTVYSTLGDTQFGTQIGDQGGVSFAIRGTKLALLRRAGRRPILPARRRRLQFQRNRRQWADRHRRPNLRGPRDP